MNINELIYLYFLKDESAFQDMYTYLYPIIVSTMSRTMNDMYHMKDEMIELSQQVLFECLEKCRVDRYHLFIGYYRRSLQNRWSDLYAFEKRHDISMKYESISLDSFIQEKNHMMHHEVIAGGHDVHDQVMMKIERERLDRLAQEYFTYQQLHILSLRRMGMSVLEIAKTMEISETKVRTILSKLKKWYTVH